MKRLACILSALAAYCAGAAESYCVYEATDLTGAETLLVLSSEEAKEFTKDIEAERKVWDKVLGGVSQEWRSGEERGTFPRSAVKPRKLTPKGRPVASAELADAELVRREAAAAKRAEKQPKKSAPKLNPKAQARANEVEMRRARAVREFAAKLAELTGHEVPSYSKEEK